MTIGLSTYSFFWQWHAETALQPIGLAEMVERTANLGVSLLQICDYPLIESYSDDELKALKALGDSRGVAFELGTRGVTPEHLALYLRIARALDITLVRSMFYSAISRPTPEQARQMLEDAVPAYEQAGVTIALETYEQVPTATLVDVVTAVGSPNLGICLDPANCVAALEHPDDVVRRTAALVKNIHVKDFSFSRKDGWVGFTLAGIPLGEGLLDYHGLIAAVRPDEQGINQIIEHWVPWQGDSTTTCDLEDRWTVSNLETLRSYSK
ncbi:sugar phosphate isomerase/epimerase family protein [Kineosporia sp. NBRC 101731]|uniref:sugar phosphate isomerase/epimerase family protein n=1 Tax=Kineosporia sp. NBRC 101731 TaxID=3032199 RepID=UPI0024A32EAA|nr:sugar phosphate isomerase/epimerase family protein [Kineosporia sp. NBRC 101731]GLY29537.1 sugar phosphate isomerase [Kineosporia sp. NBRC 101731]